MDSRERALVNQREASIISELQDDLRAPSSDPYLHALSQAFYERVSRDPVYYDWYMGNVHYRATKGPFSGTHALDMTKKLLQFQAIKEHPDFPYGFEEQEAWQPYIEKSFSDKEARSNFEHYMFAFSLATNVWQRTIGQMLIAATNHPEAYREGYAYMDMGCSGNLGPAYMHAYHNPDISPETLKRHIPDVIQKSVGPEFPIHALLHIKPRFTKLHGIDPMAVSDEDYEWWRLACRNPLELASSALKEETLFLRDYRDTNPIVRFTLDNWDVPRHEDIPEKPHRIATLPPRSHELKKSERFHQIGNNFVTYLLSQEGVINLIDNEEMRLEDDGIISITGHIRLNPKAEGHPANQIVHTQHWRNKKLPVQTVIKRKGSEKFELFAQWSDGRMNSMQPQGRLLRFMTKAA